MATPPTSDLSGRNFVLRFPVTLLLGVQYGPLAVLPAIFNANPYLPFIVSVVLLGLLASASTEWLLRIVRPPKAKPGPLRAHSQSYIWIITIAGAVATIGSTWFGASTYSTQLGLTSASPLAAALTPFRQWLLFGCAFALMSWRANGISRLTLLILLAFAGAAELVDVLWIAIVAPLMQFALSIGAGLVLVGFFRPRWLLLGLALAMLTWPTLYSVRNVTRIDVAGSQFGPVSGPDPQMRLREDLRLQEAAAYGQLDIPQPNAMDILRFGLIPRVLDPTRGQLPGGTELSAALGSSRLSSNTFTTLGTLWSLNGGFIAVALYAALVAILFSLICRRLTPARLTMGMLCVYNFVWIESTYPDNVAAFLQGLVSLAVALVVVELLRRISKPSGATLATRTSPTID
jgi:hypothetical protein